MTMPRLSATLLACVLVLGTAACTAQQPAAVNAEATVGSRHLAPSFEPRAAGPAHRIARQHRTAVARSSSSPTPGRSASAPEPGGPRGSTGSSGPGSTPSPAGSLAASVRDRGGDVAGGLGAPSYVDLTGAHIEASDGSFVLRVEVAAALPQRQESSDKTMNVASFYDVDADGTIDYEVWATLADNGWSGSYRYPDGARFGDESGVTVRPDGKELVLRFPRGHLGSARSFQWAVGSEWGTYEQISTGTTASDHAPDRGAVRFPS